MSASKPGDGPGLSIQSEPAVLRNRKSAAVGVARTRAADVAGNKSASASDLQRKL